MSGQVTGWGRGTMLMMLAVGWASSPASDTKTDVAAKVPFVVGLTTVRSSVTPKGDYESIRVVDSITPDGYRVVLSGEMPADDGNGVLDNSITRTVRAEDQRAARKIRLYFHTSDPPKFPGTVPGFSTDIMNELRTTGKAVVTYQNVNSTMFGITVVNEMKGTLARVPGGATATVLVNGRMTRLPVLHAKGALSDGSQNGSFEFDVIDDLENPLVLRFSGAGSTSKVIRIEYPEPKQAAESLENTLAAKEPALVYGIYFSFNRADIRPQSERVLKEIATVMRDHPDWQLRIDGHTDNVGNDAANLDLSKRRAAAVKDALVSRFSIDAARLTTGGYGEGSPQDTNEKPEGRARNRRVELRRE